MSGNAFHCEGDGTLSQTDCLWSLHSCRYLKFVWTWSWIWPNSRWPCMGRGIRSDDYKMSL